MAEHLNPESLLSLSLSPPSFSHLALTLHSHTSLSHPTLSLSSTWGGDTPPIEGDTVFIQAGRTVLLDISPPRLMLLVVEGNLIFDSEQPDLWLQVSQLVR